MVHKKRKNLVGNMARNPAGGFSLIEIITVVGVISMLFATAFFLGFPEYDRYAMSLEKDLLVEALLESRTKSSVGDSSYTVSVWSNGYCIQDILKNCIVPVHSLPTNMLLKSEENSTSTKIYIAFSDDITLRTEINIDENGFIDGK